MTRGRFIALEGGEGAGKTTQLARLAERIRATGREVVTTREPGGTPGAEAIRQLLVTGAPERWSAVTEALLLNAGRADHVERLIRPALERGAWVLCDRFIVSTLAYQGAGKGIDPDRLLALHDLACGGLWPDLSLWLDLPPEEGRARADARGDEETRFEAHGDAFHARVRGGLRRLASERPGQVCRIDASGGIDAVEARLWAAVVPLVAS